MSIGAGSDHAGFRLKGAVTERLAAAGQEIEDLGTFSQDPVDYPPICAAVARLVVAGGGDGGIVIGGSGQREAMAANKVRGAGLVATELTLDSVDEFMCWSFDGGWRVARLTEITTIQEEEAAKGPTSTGR